MASVAVTPVQAQQYAGTRNSRQGSIGDIQPNKLSAKIEQLPGLNFRPIGLFGDAEVFGSFGTPRPFIYTLPDFSGAGLNFDGLTFDEYLTLVANSFSLNNSSDYLFRFQVQNEVTALNPDFIPTFDQVIQVHRQDFVAGGGFLPLPGGPRTPTLPPDPTDPVDPPVFTPFPTDDPAAPADPADPADTSAATLLEDANVLSGDALDEALAILNADGASQSAPDAAPLVSAVPEPATLGLLIAGATAVIGRRRR